MKRFGDPWPIFWELKQACSAEVRSKLLHDYAGRKFGLDFFVEIVQSHNSALSKDWNDEEVAENFCVGFAGRDELEMTMRVIGMMDSRRSFWILEQFASDEYHPLVRMEALVSMGYAKRYLKLNTVMQVLRESESVLLLYGALVATEYGFLCLKHLEIRKLVEAHMSHPRPIIYGSAKNSLECL